MHWDASEAREGWFEVRELEGIWPVVLVWGAKHLEYFEDLVDFTVAHEKGFLLSHFCENAAS